ncbi:hypothetical protein BaRGS_00017849 [Batillaria attramentaria]|uniref:non-specific serine/threonine protein kinase n=1 Tax=Batillaria attramentaria TaxID=370345 RepID=A0ABD0KW38_9CAEN
MFRVGGPLWAQATAGDNAFAKIIKTGKKILRKVLQKDVGPAKGRELPKPTWSLSAKPVQLKERAGTKLIGGLFPKQLWNTQASELRRRAALRLISNSRKVPVFAFVGLSLGASLEQKRENAEDVLCSGIRGLFQQYEAKSSQVVSGDQQFSLETLELGQLIGKGCNAAVYEARPVTGSHPFQTTEAVSVDNPEVVAAEASPELAAVEQPPSVDQSATAVDSFHTMTVDDLNANAVTVEAKSESPPDADANSLPALDLEDDFTIIDEDTDNDPSDGADLSGWVFYKLSPVTTSMPDPDNDSDSDSDIFILAAEEDALQPIPETLDMNGGWSIHRAPSGGDMVTGTDVASSTASSADLGEDTASSCLSSVISREEEMMSTTDEFTDDLEPAPNIDESETSDYPLAVKMMFNYSVESKADHIMTAMVKETVPAQSRPSDQTVGRSSAYNRKKHLPPHPNIVTMHGVFVDQTPSLPGDSDAYPSALPPRLHKDGFGRNSTLFLVMKKYTMTLREFLAGEGITMATRCRVFAQLLEGVTHLGQHGIAHRDLKSDNILIDLTDGTEHPLLAVSDFGCCLADTTHGLKIPYVTGEVDKGGNCALMAPEIKCAEPGVGVVLDYSLADLWAAGALAYEIFGLRNPFYGPLDARCYSDGDLPELPAEVPDTVRKLVQLMLQRDPSQRPTPAVAATVIQLYLWAPADLRPLKSRSADCGNAQRLWQYKRLCDWLEQLAVEAVCQRVFRSEGPQLDVVLKHLFLSRVTQQDILTTVSFE